MHEEVLRVRHGEQHVHKRVVLQGPHGEEGGGMHEEMRQEGDGLGSEHAGALSLAFSSGVDYGDSR